MLSIWLEDLVWTATRSTVIIRSRHSEPRSVPHGLDASRYVHWPVSASLIGNSRGDHLESALCHYLCSRRLELVPLYAQSFSCKPIGYKSTPATGGGLGFGELLQRCHDHGWLRVDNDDPGRSIDRRSIEAPINQLDPSQPAHGVQAVDTRAPAKSRLGPGGKWAYSSILGNRGQTSQSKADVYTIWLEEVTTSLQVPPRAVHTVAANPTLYRQD